MEEKDDKAKILDALGGKKGLLDSGLPAVLFLIIFNISDDLQVALYGAIGTSIVLTIIRLAMRDTIQHVISGLIGVLFCAYLANRSGNASDFYIRYWERISCGERIRSASVHICVRAGFGSRCSLGVSLCNIQFIKVAM